MGNIQVQIFWWFKSIHWMVGKKSATPLYSNSSKHTQLVLQLHKLKHVKPLTAYLPFRCDFTSMHEGDVLLFSNEHTHYWFLIGKLSYMKFAPDRISTSLYQVWQEKVTTHSVPVTFLPHHNGGIRDLYFLKIHPTSCIFSFKRPTHVIFIWGLQCFSAN